MISSVAEAEVALERFYGITESTIGKDITVARMERLMRHLGNPEKHLKVIHIAGTSGKTSTSYFIAAMMQTAGVRVGLTVSPHIDSITERIQLDGKPIPEKLFCSYMDEFLSAFDDIAEPPTWSECIMAFALWVFAKEKLDYAVVETMLGGLHDATNVLQREDKVCVITDIGYDHMAILGDTLEKIAYQKAGIIHPGNHVLMYIQGSEVTDVVKKRVTDQTATATFLSEDDVIRDYEGTFDESFPPFQRRNWLLAREAFLYIAHRDSLPVDGNKLADTQSVQVPARMDVRHMGETNIVMDAAHNEQKMRAFVDSYRTLYGDEKVPVLLAVKEGKELADIIPLIASIASEVIITTFTKIQDLPIISMEASKVAAAFSHQGYTSFQEISDQNVAHAALLSLKADTAIITGSFFLIAQLREQHEELKSKI